MLHGALAALLVGEPACALGIGCAAHLRAPTHFAASGRRRPPLAALPLPDEPTACAVRLLEDAGVEAQPHAVSELTTGFCNWVYRIELPGPAAAALGASSPVVVAKVFSPLAKLRLPADVRGAADEAAGVAGLGPRVLHRSADGILVDFVPGITLTEAHFHRDTCAPGGAGTRAAASLAAIARRLASLHGAPACESAHDPPVALWLFIERMLHRIAAKTGPETPRAERVVLPGGVRVGDVAAEVGRMRARCDALSLPAVACGHGDLKPSNVMAHDGEAVDAAPPPGAPAADDDSFLFIDFELSGTHYRGYDLFKLFRTSDAFRAENLRLFLSTYLDESTRVGGVGEGAAGSAAGGARGAGGIDADVDGCEALPDSAELDELVAETRACEPLTWLEAAVFFFFAIAEYPSEAYRWEALATQRWERYLQTAPMVDAEGDAAQALLAARARRYAGDGLKDAAERLRGG